MTPEAIHDALQQRFGEAITAFDADAIDPTITVEASAIHDVGAFLRSEPGLSFDSLMCLSGVDYGAEKNTLGVVYHLHSTALRHTITLRVEVPRQDGLIPSSKPHMRTHEHPPEGTHRIFKPYENAPPSPSESPPPPHEGTVVPTVCDIWRTAEWHEREAFDLFGMRFDRHPDHRRILLPDDWEGHPLLKDYQVQEFYQGIPVPYEGDPPEIGMDVYRFQDREEQYYRFQDREGRWRTHRRQ